MNIDQSLIEQYKLNTNYLGNAAEWAQILRHVIYHDAQVKFNLWQLCETRSEASSKPNRIALVASRPKTVSI